MIDRVIVRQIDIDRQIDGVTISDCFSARERLTSNTVLYLG